MSQSRTFSWFKYGTQTWAGSSSFNVLKVRSCPNIKKEPLIRKSAFLMRRMHNIMMELHHVLIKVSFSRVPAILASKRKRRETGRRITLHLMKPNTVMPNKKDRQALTLSAPRGLLLSLPTERQASREWPKLFKL